MRFRVWDYFKRAFLYFSLVHIGIYTLYHVFFNVEFENEALALIFGYAHIYVIKVWQMLYPALSSMLMLIAYCRGGIKKALLGGAILSAASLLHSLPYFYIELIKYGFDTVESILLSLLISILYAILCFGFTCLGLLLGKLPFRKYLTEDKTEGEAILNSIGAKGYFYTALPSVRCALILASLGSLIPLANEIYSTVTALVDYGSSLRQNEIFLMVFNYVYIIAAWVLTHASALFIKDKIISKNNTI